MTDEETYGLSPAIVEAMREGLNEQPLSWLVRKQKLQRKLVKELSIKLVTEHYQKLGLQSKARNARLEPWMMSALAIEETTRTYRVKPIIANETGEELDHNGFSEQYARRSGAKHERNTLFGAWTSRAFTILLATGSIAGTLNVVFFSLDWKSGVFFGIFSLLAYIGAMYPGVAIEQLKRHQIDVLAGSRNIDLALVCRGYKADSEGHPIARINDVRLLTSSGGGFNREVESHQIFGALSGLLSLPLLVVAASVLFGSLFGFYGFLAGAIVGLGSAALVLKSLVRRIKKTEHQIIWAITEVEKWLVCEHLNGVATLVSMFPDNAFLQDLVDSALKPQQ